MVKEIFTMYDIGDTVWTVRYPDKFDFSTEYKLRVFKDTISNIRVFFNNDGSSKVQYFLKGLHSYEGENWFDETPEENDWDAIFPTEEEAREHHKRIWGDEDEYDD